MKNIRFTLIAGLLLIALGATVVVAWYLKIPRLIQIQPGIIGLTFNTALCFILSGIAVVLTAHSRWQGIQIACGLIMLMLATAVLSQDIFNISLHIDDLFCKVWLIDPNPYPGRMAPNTSITFMLSGLALIALPFGYKKFIGSLVQAFASLVVLAGVFSLMGYILKIELLYSWYSYTRMPVHAEVGFIILGLSLWAAIWHKPWFVEYYVNHIEEKIMLLCAGLMLCVSIVAGMAGFATFIQEHKTATSAMLQSDLQDNASRFKEAINSRYAKAQSLVNSTLVQDAVQQASPSNLDSLNAWLQPYKQNGLLGLKVVDPQSKTIYQTGNILTHSRAHATLALPMPTKLLWNGSWSLEVTEPVSLNDVVIGSVITQWSLPGINAMFNTMGKINSSEELIVCKYASGSKAACFPSHSTMRPFTVDLQHEGRLLPVAYALLGKTGTIVSPDYQGHMVLAAYMPLPALGLGLVLKVNTIETFSDIREKLNIATVAIVLIIFFGISLLYWQVMPLITRVTRSERQLRESEAYKTAILESALDSILTIRKDCSIISGNSHVAQSFGYQHHEIIGSSLPVLLPDFSSSMLAANQTLETKALRRNGQTFPAELSIAAMHTEWEDAYVVVIRDITERKRVEQLKNEFVSTVSHELRTPLTSIRGALGLLVGGALGTLENKVQHMLNIAHQNCERLIRLINDILDIEKIELGKLEYRIVEVDLNALAEESIAINQGFADKFGVTLSLVKSKPALWVSGDHDRLIQVLTNLISNAVKFSPEQGEVKVIITEQQGKARVAVSDQGSGIPEAFRARIFQKFAQADASLRKQSGTGLGLSICKAIVEKLNGSIHFSSVMNEGTVFYFDLPLLLPTHNPSN